MNDMKPTKVKSNDMDDKQETQGNGSVVKKNQLEFAIGRQVHEFRNKLGLTVADLARQASLSTGMLSKIENGMTSPSLATLQALSTALNVPVTSFFRKYEEQRDATFVKSGTGLIIERRGSRASHQYQLLGHSMSKSTVLEPYIVTLTETPDVLPLFQHAGQEFIFILEGEVTYRHADKLYQMAPGDSLFFDADVPHGPEELIKLPIRLISIMVYPRSG